MQLSEDYASHLVSKDTLFVDDLLFACLHFLQTEPIDPALTEIIQAMEQQVANTVLGPVPPQADQKEHILLDEIFPLLEGMAPKGHFFGIHPSDPGRVGFWENGLRFSAQN